MVGYYQQPFLLNCSLLYLFFTFLCVWLTAPAKILHMYILNCILFRLFFQFLKNKLFCNIPLVLSRIMPLFLEGNFEQVWYLFTPPLIFMVLYPNSLKCFVSISTLQLMFLYCKSIIFSMELSEKILKTPFSMKLFLIAFFSVLGSL